MKALKGRLAFVGFVVAATALLFVMLESVSFVFNARSGGGTLPFLVDAELLRGEPEGRSLSYLDPLLGAAHNPSVLESFGHRTFHGFEVFGDPDDRHALRIITLGGSTTECFSGNWPKALYQECRKRNIPVVLFNGGVSSYGSAQELLKLIRDGILLRPDVVVSYDGVNDRGGGDGRRRRLLHPVHSRIYSRLLGGGAAPLMPNTVAALRRSFFSKNAVEGIEWGVPDTLTPAAEWLLNVRTMNAVAAEFGFHYVDFLQPAFGVGSDRPSREERARVNVPDGERQSLDGFYREALRSAPGRRYVVDLTNVLAGRGGFYRDFCHIDEEGNLLVGRAVFRELESRRWLERRNIPPAR
ncbi:MAG: hypothetical protein PHS14_17350 [Elusimicrobia bacterium]|nr:hypothetical protein [Elusimicrobiota bacterium]